MAKHDDILKLRKASSSDINAKIFELKKTLMDFRFQLASGQLKDLSVIRKVRRNIAKLGTYLSEQKKNAKDNNKQADNKKANKK